MSSEVYSEDRVGKALSGEALLLRGASFVPPRLLAEAMRIPSGVNPLVSSCEELSLDFAFLRATDVSAISDIERLNAVGTAPLLVIDGPFGRAAEERGWAAALADVIRDREGLTERVMAFAHDSAERLAQFEDAGIGGVVVAEDLAVATGLLMGPDDAVDIIFPALALVAEKVTEYGLPCILHSDGDIVVFLRRVSDAGFSAVHLGGSEQGSFESQYWAARDMGLAVVGGLEGAALRGGPEQATSLAAHLKPIALARGLLVADDGGTTTLDEMRAYVAAMRSLQSIGGD